MRLNVNFNEIILPNEEMKSTSSKNVNSKIFDSRILRDLPECSGTLNLNGIPSIADEITLMESIDKSLSFNGDTFFHP